MSKNKKVPSKYYRLTKADETAYRIKFNGEQVGWCREWPNGVDGGSIWECRTPNGVAMGKDPTEAFSNFVRTVPTPKLKQGQLALVTSTTASTSTGRQTWNKDTIIRREPTQAAQPLTPLQDFGRIPFRLLTTKAG